jgi:four helix bundle protein
MYRILFHLDIGRSRLVIGHSHARSISNIQFPTPNDEVPFVFHLDIGRSRLVIGHSALVIGRCLHLNNCRRPTPNSANGIRFALPNSRTGNHMASQLVRSGTSPALNYGEAQSAESRNDFIHKMKIVLKELRETSISLQIIKRTVLTESTPSISPVLDECCELIAIFAKSLQTAAARRKMS